METVSAVEGILEFDGGTAPNSVPSFAHAVAENKIGQKSEETAVGIKGICSFSGWNSKCNRYTLWKVENAKFF